MTLFPWFVLFVLTAANALYVAAEFAAVAAARPNLMALAKAGNRRAEGLLAVLGDGAELDRYIAACQIGITVTALVAGAYAQRAFASDLANWLGVRFQLESSTAWSTSALVILLALTAVQVVLAELVPKSLALQFPEATALFTFLPTRLSVSVYRLFIWALNGTGFLLLKPFGIEPGGHRHVHSKVEIELLLAESHKGGEISPEAHQRLKRGLRLSTRTVRQIMVPRSEIDAIELRTPPDEMLERMLESPYSRLPVYEGSLDQILGTVNSKDLVSHYAKTGRLPTLDQLLRPIVFVPEFLRADRLVDFLQEQKSSKAIVVNEFGGVQGMVSIEDVLAEVLGDIGDELQDSDSGVFVQHDGVIRLPGTLSLDEVEEFLGKPWEGSSATIGGHIVQKLGRLPQEGEELEVDGAKVVVTEMGPTTVRTISILPKPDDSDDADKGETK
ncbi:MAG TPA: hemolysin family protein [Polyangiaceae bacterium]|nr:hemolysin family protein [Polyangiaceae bacterium]